MAVLDEYFNKLKVTYTLQIFVLFLVKLSNIFIFYFTEVFVVFESKFNREDITIIYDS